jgi:hypothetical protein
MTFTEWQATRKWHNDLGTAIDCDLDGAGGFEYEASHIIAREWGFVVHIATTEAEFTTLEEAEAYLWAEWADSEING